MLRFAAPHGVRLDARFTHEDVQRILAEWPEGKRYILTETLIAAGVEPDAKQEAPDCLPNPTETERVDLNDKPLCRWPMDLQIDEPEEMRAAREQVKAWRPTAEIADEVAHVERERVERAARVRVERREERERERAARGW